MSNEPKIADWPPGLPPELVAELETAEDRYLAALEQALTAQLRNRNNEGCRSQRDGGEAGMMRKEPKRGPHSQELECIIEACRLLNPNQHRARFLDAVTSELMRTQCLDAHAVRQCVYAALSRLELSWEPRDG